MPKDIPYAPPMVAGRGKAANPLSPTGTVSHRCCVRLRLPDQMIFQF